MTDQKPNRLYRKVGQLGLAIVAAVAVVIGLASPAYANFPHFKSSSVSLASSTSGAATHSAASSAGASAQLPNLRFNWAEVGLGNNLNVDYSVGTFVTATFGCVNGGAKHPSATNKTTVTTPVGASATDSSDRNGQITGSVDVPTSSVSPPAAFSCPPGQTLVALFATFTDNTITDTTNHVTVTDEDISVTLWP